jgi:type IV secretion system protein VirB10
VPLVNAVPARQADPAPSPVLAVPPMSRRCRRQSLRLADRGVRRQRAAAAGGRGVANAGVQAAAAAGGTAANDFASRIGGVGGAPATARSDVDPKTTSPRAR